MTLLNGLVTVNWFFGLDLKTASFVIATLGVIHPMFYTCIFFIPITYLLLTIWILVVFYSGLSILLFYGILQNDEAIIRVWIWYALIFVILMVALMYLHFIAVICKKRCNQMTVTLLGILWYMTTIYFILVVNSYRKSIKGPEGRTHVLAEVNNVGNQNMTNFTIWPPEWDSAMLYKVTPKIGHGMINASKNYNTADYASPQNKTNLTNWLTLLQDKHYKSQSLMYSTKNSRNSFPSPEKIKSINTRTTTPYAPKEKVKPTLSSPSKPSKRVLETHSNKTSLGDLDATTEYSILEMTVFYIEHSPDDDKDMSSRLLLQDEQKKKRRQL